MGGVEMRIIVAGNADQRFVGRVVEIFCLFPSPVNARGL